MAQPAQSVNYEHMGPSLLAAQPVSVSKTGAKDKDWSHVFNHLEGRLAGMRKWRYSWWAYWAGLAEYILPRRYHWLVVANRTSRGSDINQSIVDGTATQSMQTCASGLWTGLTSPSRPWFKLAVGLPWADLDADAKEWLEDTEQRLYTVLGQGNAYTSLAQLFQDTVTFGTSVIVVYEDHEDVIRCYVSPLGEFYLDVGGRMSVDVFYREFTLNVSQIVDMFGLENCPEAVQEMWEEGGSSLTNEYVVCHAIEPNSPIARKGSVKGSIQRVPKQFPFCEYYWLKGNKTDRPLSKRGFWEKPFMAARWSVTSNDPYGRSPGMDALGDIKQLQLETRRKAEFLEKCVRPPMGADVELKNEPASIIPGSITYVNTSSGKKGFFPLFEMNPGLLGPMVLDIKEIQARIKSCFFTDIFMAITQMEGVQPRNELELTKRDLERLQVLGPFIELFETEVASPFLQRVMNIMLRRGMLKPMPRSMAGIPVKIEYVSIIREAQRATETVAMKDALQTAGAMSAAAKAAGVPDPLRIFKLDKALRIYCDLSSFPSEALFTEGEVAAADKAKAKMTQAMAQKQQALQATTAGVQAARTLSQTPLDGGNALGALLGRGQ